MENTNLIKKQQKIFASNTTIADEQLSVFGSKAQTGTMQVSLDPNILQNNENWKNGWQNTTIIKDCPFQEDFNTAEFVNTYNLAYLFQKGIPEYDSTTTYFKGSICLVVDNTLPSLYYSKIDNNIGNNPLTDNINWGNYNDLITNKITTNFVELDGSNATFNNLSSTAKDNIRLRAVPDYNSGITIVLESDFGWTAPADGMILAVGNSNLYALGIFTDQAKQRRLYGLNSPSAGFTTGSFIVQAGIKYYFDINNTVPVFYPFL